MANSFANGYDMDVAVFAEELGSLASRRAENRRFWLLPELAHSMQYRFGMSRKEIAASKTDQELIDAIRDCWDNIAFYQTRATKAGVAMLERIVDTYIAEKESRPSLAAYDWRGAKVA